MSQDGYYRYPCIFNDTVVFVSEDHLWRTDINGCPAQRLTSGLGTASTPVFSPCGQYLAFAGSDEGPAEVYIMPATGGEPRRVTYLGEGVGVQSWTSAGITFTSSAKSPFARVSFLWRVSPDGGEAQRIDLGPISSHMFKDHEGPACVVQRFGYREYGYWKRYRGGTAGTLWIDREGTGTYAPLIELKSDLARPLWIGDRVYFASDHEGIGNLYSCGTDGQDLQRHTHHKTFYVRNQSTDGTRIVYHAGGDLYVFDPKTNTDTKIHPAYHSARPERARKFVSAERYLEGTSLHPHGNHLGITARGQAFVFERAQGAVLQLGAREGVRYRLPTWLADGLHVALISDVGGSEILEVYDAKTAERTHAFEDLDLGRVQDIYPSPTDNALILVNQRGEIIHLDVEGAQMRVLDRSHHEMVAGVSWSPDGLWIAYHCSLSQRQACIKLANIKTGALTQATNPILKDTHPAFDPDGKYLYFLSQREFNPSWDTLHFNLGFPAGERPYCLLLAKDTPSPFILQPKGLEDEDDEDEDKKEDDKGAEKGEDKGDDKALCPKPITIDLEGLSDRMVAFPVEPGNFSHLCAIKGKLMYISWPLFDASDEDSDEPQEGGALACFDFESMKEDELTIGVTHLEVSADAKRMLYRTSKNVRIVKAGEKADDALDAPAHKSGWVDLSRVTISVNPFTEWHQIYHEAWRLQRDYFWVEDMSQIDWQAVHDRYAPLLNRISTRRELSDIVWEMQGELGTSHAYVSGGDLRPTPSWRVGLLGADFAFNPKMDAYEIKHMGHGDPWREGRTSSLRRPGLNLSPGDLIWRVGGQAVSKDMPLEGFLTSQAGKEVSLTVSDAHGNNKRDVVVKTLRETLTLSYLDWVAANRAYVHEKSKGQVGYVHVPDMGANGFAYFHRGYLAECDKPGLIIDVRYNGGGSVSPLILSKLVATRLGYDLTRWFGNIPYPVDASHGNLVGLTNEYAGSDGDMFSHAFKMLGLGPLVGKRTWGGVIGIWPRNALVDGGMTTQPEFSFWFKDIGWGLENYGATPTIEVENTPQDYLMGRDPQLDCALGEALRLIKENPVGAPAYTQRPNLALPKLAQSG